MLMESTMKCTEGTVFAAVPRENTLTPQQKRRNKLVAHLREQLAMAEAVIDGRVHVVKKRRWERTQGGQKHLIEVDKRLKQCWKPQGDGRVLLSVRYGAKPIEFEKGKDAVVLADIKQLAAVLPKLIAATEAGELDAHINAVTKAKQPVVTKR
jgi:hypothetical protein